MLVSICKIVRIGSTCLGTCILSCSDTAWSPYIVVVITNNGLSIRDVCNRYVENFNVFFCIVASMFLDGYDYMETRLKFHLSTK